MAMRTNAPRGRGTSVAVALTGVVVLALLVPRAAGAVNQLVSIVDGDGTSKAQVDNGKLRVGDGAGKLSIDGAIRISNTTDKPIPIRGFGAPVVVSHTTPMSGTTGTSILSTVPAHKLLVIESVSVSFEIEAGQTFRGIDIRVGGSGNVSAVLLAPTFVAGKNGVRDDYTFSGEYRLYAHPGDTVQAEGFRNESAGGGFITGSISGYLVPTP